MSQEELKTRLKLKFNRKLIDRIVKENFDYAPSFCDVYDEALKIEGELLSTAREKYPKLYNDFLDNI